MNTAGAIGMLVWCAAWIAIAAHVEKKNRPDALGTLLVAFAGSSCALVFAGLPRAGIDIGQAARWVHHAAFTSLGVFLLGSEFLHTSARRHAALPGNLTETRYRQWWWLTELMPGATALTLMLSGLRLIYENPLSCSLQESWLFWLVVAFAFFFADGLCFYRPTIRELALSARSNTRADISRLTRLQLTLHAVSFPVVFALAHGRWPLPHPFRTSIQKLEGILGFLPQGWPQVTCAALVIAVIGGGIWFARTLSRKKFRPQNGASS